MDTLGCTIENIWRRACELLKAALGVGAFNMWFSPSLGVAPVSISEEEFVLGFPPRSYIEWAENYKGDVAKALEEVTGHRLKVVFRVREVEKASAAAEQSVLPPASAEATRVAAFRPSSSVVSAGTTAGTELSVRRASPWPSPSLSLAAPWARGGVSPRRSAAWRSELLARLNPQYTFDSFVVGDNNRFAFRACQEAVVHPGMTYNPLFIHGQSGLGKTHLLQSIARAACEQHPDAVVEYLTSEEFGNRYIEACGNRDRGAMAEFRQHFRNVDVLLIDDVQFFAGKEGMQEEFFHTFNALHNEHRQIVCAADRIPQEMKDINTRLVSRFEWGLMVDILPPDMATRLAILAEKEQVFERKVPEEILRYLATRIRSNVRKLEGSLLTLHSTLSAREGADGEVTLTQELVDRLVGNQFELEQASQPSLPQIQETVARYFDVRLPELKGKCRAAEIALPRQVAMYLCRKLTDKSLPVIAEGFNKSHPTVLHSIAAIEKKMTVSETLRQQISNIERTLQRG